MIKTADKNSLVGRAAMVVPGLPNDVLNNRGRAGIIVHTDPEWEMLLLYFGPGNHAEYNEKDVVTLYPRKILLQTFFSNGKVLPENLHNAFHNVLRLLSEGRDTWALQTAMLEKGISNLCTINCHDFKAQFKHNRMGNNKTGKRNN